MITHNGVVTLACAALAACIVASPVHGDQPEGLVSARSHGWKTTGSMPSTQYEVATAVHEGRLYVFGGFRAGSKATTRCDVFDPSTNTWQRLADMPQAVNHLNAVLVGEDVWFAGGTEGDNPGPVVSNVWRYNLRADSFTAGPSLPEPRGGGGLAHVEGVLHYFSGIGPDRNTDAADHWVLDLQDPIQWERAEPFPSPRNQFGVAVLDGRIYAIGGQFRHDQSPEDQALVHVYDPAARRWSRGADLPRARSHIEPSTFVHRGRIYVAGGRDRGELIDDMWSFDPRRGTWSRAAELPEGLLGPVVAVVGDRIVLVGGAAEELQPRDAVWQLGLEQVDEGG